MTTTKTQTETETITYSVRNARGVVHSLTAGRTYSVRGDKITNRPDSEFGKADCGAITNSASALTDAAVTCPKCQ